MRRILCITSILIMYLFVFLSSYIYTEANFSEQFTTKSFGGKVLLTPIPGVSCKGSGKLMILSSSIGAVKKATKGEAGESDTDKATRILGSALDVLPIYATRTDRQPRILKNALGRKKIAPNFTLCQINTPTPIPIPILKTTNNYNFGHD